MSLVAKLEAVIYAAEEPVSLAQLTQLFADEALEHKAALAAAESESESEQAAENQQFAYDEEPEEAETKAEPGAEAEAGSEAEVPETEDAEPPAGAEVVDLAAEEKRLAKQREREARAVIKAQLDQLIAQYASDERGIEIREIAGGYRMATKPECHDAVRGFVKSLKPALKLSLPALETLAVIAYKQPVTAPEVNEIRGVESTGVFGSLLSRKLIATAGRKPVIGRPILYKTTREFLLRFGLKDLGELPSMEEFEKLAALELEEPEESTSDSEQAAPPDAPAESGASTLNFAADDTAVQDDETAGMAASATEPSRD